MKQSSFSKTSLYLFSICFIFLSYSCAPVFSEMQSASTVGEGQMDGTVNYSAVKFSDDSNGEIGQKEFGLQGAYGISDKLDIRVRYSNVKVNDEDISANVLGFGPKYNIVTDRLSVYVPIGFAFGEDVETGESIQIHPTILGTIPIANRFEFNPSAKVLFPFSDDSDTTLGFNLGLGIEITDAITLRPEYGMLFNPGEEGNFRQFSVGVTFNPSGRSVE